MNRRGLWMLFLPKEKHEIMRNMPLCDLFLLHSHCWDHYPSSSHKNTVICVKLLNQHVRTQPFYLCFYGKNVIQCNSVRIYSQCTVHTQNQWDQLICEENCWLSSAPSRSRFCPQNLEWLLYIDHKCHNMPTPSSIITLLQHTSILTYMWLPLMHKGYVSVCGICTQQLLKATPSNIIITTF